MLQDGTKNVIDSMQKFGVKRVSVVTSIGANDSYDQAPFLFKVPWIPPACRKRDSST